MLRRDFITLVGGAAAGWPLVARAQQRTQAIGKIGYLNQRTILPIPTTLSVLKPIWEQLGYVEDETVIFRSAEGELSRVPGLIAELINRGSGVLVVVGAQAVRAASRTTTTVPIVAIDLETDPIRAGLISSFAHPGGNITGLFLDLPSLAGKWIELLQELLPSVQRIVIGWDGTTGDDQLEVAKAVAVARGLEVVVLETSTSGGFDEAFQRLGDDKRSGIIHLSSPGFSAIAPRFAAAAEKYRLPSIAFLKSYASTGVLATYGPQQETYFSRVAAMTEKILKGEKAGDIPIEQPTKYELVINLKTAKALGLTVSPALLARADEVIE
jgi:putative tryptophan/tyrosine transport system substrate-binding protein